MDKIPESSRQEVRKVIEKYGGPGFIKMLPKTEQLLVSREVSLAGNRPDSAKKIGKRIVATGMGRAVTSNEIRSYLAQVEEYICLTGLSPDEVRELAREAIKSIPEWQASAIAEKYLGENEQREVALRTVKTALRYWSMDSILETAKRYGISMHELTELAKPIFESLMRSDDSEDLEKAKGIASYFLCEAEKKQAQIRIAARELSKHGENFEYVERRERAITRLEGQGFDRAEIQEILLLALGGLNESFEYFRCGLSVLDAESHSAAAKAYAITRMARGEWYDVQEVVEFFSLDQDFLLPAAMEIYDKLLSSKTPRDGLIVSKLVDNVLLLHPVGVKKILPDILRNGARVDKLYRILHDTGLTTDDVKPIASKVFEELMGRDTGSSVPNYRFGAQGLAYVIASTWLGEEEKKMAAGPLIKRIIEEFKRFGNSLDTAIAVARECGLEGQAAALENIRRLRG